MPTNLLDKILGQGNTTLELLPAYGRTYQSAEDALTDWYAGRDWQIWKGPYCSNRDIATMIEMGYTDVHLIWDIGRASCHFPLKA